MEIGNIMALIIFIIIIIIATAIIECSGKK